MGLNIGAIIIEGHVQGLSNVRSLGERGIPVVVIDKHNCIARYSKYCKSFFICPDYKSQEFISFLLNLAKQEGLKDWLLLPSNDHAVYNLAKNKKQLSEYYKIVTEDLERVENIYNKEKLLISAIQANVPVPRSWFPKNFSDLKNEKFEFPLLIKGKFGLNFYKATGKKAFLCTDQSIFDIVIAELSEKVEASDLFIQELIVYGSNKTISFTAFSIQGVIKTHWIGEKIREHPFQFGTSTYSRSIENKLLLEYSQRLLKQLDYTGVCEIEFLLETRDNQYKLIEINARTWLWVELARKCGVDYALYCYNYVNNLDIVFPKKYEIDREWMHYVTDVPFSLLGLIKRHYQIVPLVKSWLKHPLPAVIRLNDPLPFIAEIFLLPLLIIKR